MASGTAASTAKVGILVVVFVGLLVAGYQFLGGKLFVHPSHYYVLVNDAGGLTVGAAVKQAGVQIGSVSKVKLANPKEARLTLEINEPYKLPVGATASIPGSIIGLGNPELDIVPPETPAGDLPPGSTITGSKSGPLDAVLPDAKTTMKELNATLIATRRLLEDKDLKGGVTDVLKTSKATLEKFQQLAGQTQALLASNQSSISGAVQNATLAMGDIRKGTAMAYRLLKEGKFQSQALYLLNSLNATSAKASHLVQSLDAFVNDPQMRAALTQTLDNTRDLTSQGKEIAGSVKIMAKNGETISSQAITLTQKATEVANEAKTLVGKLSGLVDKVEGKLGVVSPPKGLIGTVSGEADLIHEFHPGYNRTDFSFTIPVAKETLYAGVFDAFESNKLSLQLGKPLGPNGVFRYGIYASKPGVGVDYSLLPRLGLRADVFDINHARYDLRAKYLFGGGIVGWFGYDHVFDKGSFSVGVGFQK